MIKPGVYGFTVNISVESGLVKAMSKAEFAEASPDKPLHSIKRSFVLMNGSALESVQSLKVLATQLGYLLNYHAEDVFTSFKAAQVPASSRIRAAKAFIRVCTIALYEGFCGVEFSLPGFSVGDFTFPNNQPGRTFWYWHRLAMIDEAIDREPALTWVFKSQREKLLDAAAAGRFVVPRSRPAWPPVNNS